MGRFFFLLVLFLFPLLVVVVRFRSFFHCQAFLLHPGSAEGAADHTRITEDELALFGSVVAEVDRWYKR